MREWPQAEDFFLGAESMIACVKHTEFHKITSSDVAELMCGIFWILMSL